MGPEGKEVSDMLQIILTLALTAPSAPKTTAQVQPCVWPNTCVVAPVAQVQPCVWPNTCVSTPVLQVETCVWPHRCS